MTMATGEVAATAEGRATGTDSRIDHPTGVDATIIVVGQTTPETVLVVVAEMARLTPVLAAGVMIAAMAHIHPLTEP